MKERKNNWDSYGKFDKWLPLFFHVWQFFHKGDVISLVQPVSETQEE